MKHYLIFLAVGATDYLNEALFSLLSFCKNNPDTEIKTIIYTDTPDFFRSKTPQNAIVRNISPSELSNWKGPDNFINRVKIKVLQDAVQHYSGSFLFVDSDTVFRKNISEIFIEIDKGELFFDKCEGLLEGKKGGIAKKTRKVLQKQNSFELSTTEKAVFEKSFVVWNSGVIGLNSSHATILKAAEELTDQLYALEKLFVMEQLALSYLFQKSGRPKSTEKHIHHYWYFKEFRSVLKDFFNVYHLKKFEELVPKTTAIEPETLAIPKLEYKKMSFFQKTTQKILKGYKWKIPKYQLG
ncbi:hypothetical protein ABGT15_07070 [Flavobacterium enshiense]|uniref:hypothetical protein n=1 Tax=Flavobacterium enshiense TaxID=1341165 RepID=UPI00345D245D